MTVSLYFSDLCRVKEIYQCYLPRLLLYLKIDNHQNSINQLWSLDSASNFYVFSDIIKKVIIPQSKPTFLLSSSASQNVIFSQKFFLYILKFIFSSLDVFFCI